MELKRKLGYCVCFVLCLFGEASGAALPGVNHSSSTADKLECTNDLMEWMVCDLEAHNCAQYSMRIWRKSEEVRCIFNQLNEGQCRCSTQMTLIYGEIHTATLWKRGERVGSKDIYITDTIKPRVPTIISVNESNGDYQVMWRSNMRTNWERFLDDNLSANVTYYKKGDTTKVSEHVTPTTVNGLKSYSIVGLHLEPSTTYVVCVRSYLHWSRRFSDCSEEKEFTTPMSHNTVIWMTIVSLSIAAIIISGAVYGCYVKLKAMWWDTVAKCPNPKLPLMNPSEPELLKPVLPVMSLVHVEPSVPDDDKPWLTEPVDVITSVQNALDRAFPNISPLSPVTATNSGLYSSPYNLCGVRADDITSGRYGFDNNTYSILLPSFPQQSAEESLRAPTQDEILCDSSYHRTDGDSLICSDQQLPACLLSLSPPVVSPLVETDMSYQVCNTDAMKVPPADVSSWSSTSSSASSNHGCEVKAESCDEVDGDATMIIPNTEKVVVYDKNPCYGCAPTASLCSPLVDYDYQAFQSVVDLPDPLFPGKQSAEEHLIKCPEQSFTKKPESIISPVVSCSNNYIQSGSDPPCLQRPFLFTDQAAPIIMVSGYQSV